MEVFIKLIVVLATYLEEDNVLLSVFQLFYVQTPAVFRNGRPTVDQIILTGDAMYVKAFRRWYHSRYINIVADTFTRPSTSAYGRVTADPAKLNQLPTARPAN